MFNRGVARKRVDWAGAGGTWSEDADAVLASDVDVVVELAGGLDPAGGWVRKALARVAPNTLFVFSGAGNHAVGGNGYWVTQHQNETGYLMGMIAGLMTKTDTVGVVGSFPGDETNAEVNGFFDGARAANPEVKRKLAYIQSWYDPQKSASATSALASAGADYILELAPAFEACQAAKVGCFGNYVDLNSLAPDVVVTSSLATWDPMINYILDQWWAHATAKAVYDAPKEAVWFGLPQGGTDLAPYHGWDATLTDAVKASVADTKAKIISGEKKLPANFDNPVAD